MADAPIGITFQPSAEAAADGPRQAGIEGQGGSDLAQAFKILSLHLPRVLGAGAIAPKRLLTSPGAAAVVGGPTGGGSFNPYSAVFQSLLQSMGAGMPSGGFGGGSDVGSLASLLGGGPTSSGSTSSGSELAAGGDYAATSGVPAPKVTFGQPTPVPDVFGGVPEYGGSAWTGGGSSSGDYGPDRGSEAYQI